MAFDDAPSAWIASWAVSGTNIVVPIASFEALTSAEAHGTDGDIRDVLFSLLETINTEWEGLAEADRPDKMEVFKSTNGTSDNKLLRTFTIRFTTDVTGEEVVAE